MDPFQTLQHRNGQENFQRDSYSREKLFHLPSLYSLYLFLIRFPKIR